MPAKIKAFFKTEGFTIIELLLVVLLIGLLTALIFSTHASLQRNQRNQERQKDLNQLSAQLEAYNVENNVYPTLAERWVWFFK